MTVSVNIWDNSYEEKAQLNKCDFGARLKAVSFIYAMTRRH